MRRETLLVQMRALTLLQNVVHRRREQRQVHEHERENAKAIAPQVFVPQTNENVDERQTELGVRALNDALSCGATRSAATHLDDDEPAIETGRYQNRAGAQRHEQDDDGEGKFGAARPNKANSADDERERRERRRAASRSP